MNILAGILLNMSLKLDFGKAVLNTSIFVNEFVCLWSAYFPDFCGREGQMEVHEDCRDYEERKGFMEHGV